MKARFARLALLALLATSCSDGPIGPTTPLLNPPSAEFIVGQMAVAFLNRFAASAVPPAACVVDFSDSCRGKRDELSDIQYNREHYEILGARLGSPSVAFRSADSADVFVPCAFDSRVLKCESAGCVVGAFEYVAGTCRLASFRASASSPWQLCDSTFSATSAPTPATQFFFGHRAN